NVLRRSDGDSLRAYVLREMWRPTRGESPSGRPRPGMHNMEKCGWGKGRPQGCSLRSSRRGDCSATPLTEPDMRARIRLFGSICQNSSDSWADTRGRLRSFHKVLSEAIRPANQDGG